MVSQQQVFETLRTYLVELFEIPPEKIRPEALLLEDLDLDSIDAVDLVVKLQDYTGRKISPAEFKSVRTVQDVVERVHAQFAP
ncbi:MAG: acyl carrier protein [Alphaproteobacteria bacterium]|nr:acyl carrier protein [Alphaproteobacteria bacterium]MCW5752385.1 acyl carrier protein [Alphaproteobacteria bacterium]